MPAEMHMSAMEQPEQAFVMDRRRISELIHRCDKEFAIPLEEDFGNREWLWFPGIPAMELEAWWGALEDVEIFWRMETRANWLGEFIRVDENLELSRLWESLWSSGTHRARVELNGQFALAEPDTYLCGSDGTMLLHKGVFEFEDNSGSSTWSIEPFNPDEAA